MRDAVVQIEILHGNVVPPRRAIKRETRGARTLCALNRFPARSRLPWRDLDRLISRKLHGFDFNSAGVMTRAAERILDSRLAMKPVHDRIAPDDRVSSLIFEPPQRLVISLVVHRALQRLPLFD